MMEAKMKLIYHINSTEQYEIKKSFGLVVVLNCIDRNKIYNINGELVYQTVICLQENLIDNIVLNDVAQLNLFS